MSKSEDLESTSTVPGSQKTENEEIASKDNLSIQQILESMTNEFNKKGFTTPEPVKKISKAELPVRKQEKLQVKVVEEINNVVKVQKSTNHVQEEIEVIKENVSEKILDKLPKDKETSPKQEITVKKDSGVPPRIVFTFRTIDENTDHGKKTKISSLPSNLSLVPDEFSNCDQIGGVSVKIEDFDEVNDETNESDVKKSDKLSSANKEQINVLEKSDSEKINISQESVESNVQIENDKDNDVAAVGESLEELKTFPNTRKTRGKRLKVFRDGSVLKRSARRLSKESFRSTVLESAMARKEKSNYTAEPTKRKYSRPGRPRKHFGDKKAPVPKLNPLQPPPQPTPLEPAKPVTETKKDIPKLTPIVLPKPVKSPNPVDLPTPIDSQKDTEPTNLQEFPIPPKQITDKKDNLPKLNPIISPIAISSLKKHHALPELSPLKLIRNMNNSFDGLTVNSVPKHNKFAEMPKLTPIIRNSEPIKSKLNNSSNKNSIPKGDSLLNNLDGPFLKPVAIKSKRDRSKSIDGAKKIMKGNCFGEILSPTSESASSLEDFAMEDNPIPSKKNRRSMTPSPSTADGVASKPESTAVISKARSTSKKIETAMQCLCESRSQIYVTITSTDAPLYCTAQDSIDDGIVGCTNEVDHDDVAMRRPSSHIPYIILCRMHKERLIRHNCCPSCGKFCSQGRFVHCSNGHQYHRGCEIYFQDKPLCPHCASCNLSHDVIITISGKRKPVSQAVTSKHPVVRKEPAARITLPGAGDNTKLVDQLPVLEKSIDPLIDPIRITIPECNTGIEKAEKYSISCLYNSVKNGELQKLVNVLACGYNANHSFREHNHRTSLHIAAEKGFLACVHILAQAGAQPNSLDKSQLSPLMLAATHGNVEVVKYLMRVGANVLLKGEDGMTALHMAAKSGHLDVCKVILSECNVPKTLIDLVDDGGWTSLIWACEFRHVKVAKFLLANKCDPMIRDAEQNIALHWSAYSGSHEITEILLNMGCETNVVNIHGDTPLHIASRRDQYAVCVLLLSRGAKVGEKNNSGETAIDCCTGFGNTLNALKLNVALNKNSENLNEKTIKILTNDITRGKENNPIQCVNGIDSEDKPTDFVYVTENCFTSKIHVDRTITSLQSCHCENNCSSDKCLCGTISLRCWYNEEGKLIKEFNYSDPPMLFECNSACDCNKITCNNRVVQHGMTQRFQLFKTDEKGWGLRTLRQITKGTYVCEYIGEIISDLEADQREDDSYLFDLDNRDGETYCIDARRYGNLARFINHSCAPNLLPVRVFIEHQDLRFPRIAFFANRDIEADEELGFDYGEKFWIIKYKSFTCTCGAENCRYSDKTIQITLNNYRQRVQAEDNHATVTVATKSSSS